MSRRLDSGPYLDYKWPRNLFWERLKLNGNKINITVKAFEIRHCCCLMREPWAPEEIGDIWGLTRKRIGHCETIAWRKIQCLG